MSQLTVIIPCKDERANIRACIASVQEIADEILIADSGSSDDTLAIVEQIGGCRVIRREYVNAGDFKNWAIPQAEHEWILILDADERVSPSLSAEIGSMMQEGPQQDGYRIKRTNYFMGYPVRYGPWGRDKLLRLFRKDVSRYVGRTDHADVQVSTGKVGLLQNRLEHYTCWEYDGCLPKQERYSRYQAQVWHQTGKPLNWIKFYLSGFFRFWHIFVFRGGFLDGAVGFQVAILIAYYSYQKQARLWQLHYGKQPLDHEPERRQAA